MPQFVILRHETPVGHARPLHWDLMLEAGNILRTWALAREPRAGEAIAAEALPDHRLAYLSYEGPLSQDRGQVTRWDAGKYWLLTESPQRIEFALVGGRLRGVAVLEREPVRDAPPQRWTFSLTFQ